MSSMPNPNVELVGPTLVTVAIPASLHMRFESACHALSMLQPLSSDVRPEDIIAALGLYAAEKMISSGQGSQLFADQGEHDDRP